VREGKSHNVERRAHARVGASILVKIANPDGSFDEFITRDISMGGLFVQTDRMRTIGEEVEMLLCFADGQEEIAILGEVARVVDYDKLSKGLPEPQGFGIRFNIIEPNLKDQLKEFLDSLLEMGGAGSREHQRIRARINITTKIGGEKRRAMLENISRGGLFLETDEDFNILDRIELVLLHPKTREQVEFIGEVIHKRESLDFMTNKIRRGIGMRFIELHEEKREKLDALIKTLMENLPPSST
jgi:Tfp pilus assembly protein PilZ